MTLWIDVAGTALSPDDRDILKHPLISGVILFSRNYESPKQLKALTAVILKTNSALTITVDQEGGRVQRFREGFTELPSMQYWGERYSKDPAQTKKDFAEMLHTMITELRDGGVDRTLVPVMDIDYGHNIVIGHRSFGKTSKIVTELSDFMIDQCHALKMPVTGKHFPGHGFVSADSHLELPIDSRTFAEIEQQDLQPFKRLSQKLDAIMLAHIVYEQCDKNPVCFSHFWIQDILRKQLHFKGLVISDDLSMQAMAKMGSYADRAKRALEAGCDILLVCNAREGVLEILSDSDRDRGQRYR